MNFKVTKFRESEVYQAYLDLATDNCDEPELEAYNKTAAENLIKKLRENRKPKLNKAGGKNGI